MYYMYQFLKFITYKRLHFFFFFALVIYKISLKYKIVPVHYQK